MDRFSETINFSSPRRDRDEDGFFVIPEPEPKHCQSCGRLALELTEAVWDADLLVGACCEVPEPEYDAMAADLLDEPEPACTCIRLDVDFYDVGGCELCDPMSRWNRRAA